MCKIIDQPQEPPRSSSRLVYPLTPAPCPWHQQHPTSCPFFYLDLDLDLGPQDMFLDRKLSSAFGKRLLPFVRSELLASGQKAVTLFYPDFSRFLHWIPPFAFLSRLRLPLPWPTAADSVLPSPSAAAYDEIATANTLPHATDHSQARFCLPKPLDSLQTADINHHLCAISPPSDGAHL
jgi:hypothetical protein